MSVLRRIQVIPHQQEPHHNTPSKDTQPKTTQPANKARKKRSDSGKERITTRDRRALGWIGEQMVVRLDHVAILLWRLGGRKDLQKGQGTLALSSTKEVVKKWSARGFAHSYKFFDDEAAYVWLTMEGQRVARLPYTKSFGGKRGACAHYTAMNKIRLQIEALYGDELEWISERRLRYRSGNNQGHIPDGVVVHHHFRAAIEAELSTKNKRTSLADMRSLAENFDNVWFFPSVTERERVERTVQKLPPDEQQSFMVYLLEG